MIHSARNASYRRKNAFWGEKIFMEDSKDDQRKTVLLVIKNLQQKQLNCAVAKSDEC